MKLKKVTHAKFLIRGCPYKTSADGRVYPLRALYAQRGLFRCGRLFALFGEKSFGFFEIYGVSRTDNGEGVNFSRFCAGVLLNDP